MLGKLDTWLMEHPKRDDLHGWRRFAVEFWFFGLKEARACLFAGDLCKNSLLTKFDA